MNGKNLLISVLTAIILVRLCLCSIMAGYCMAFSILDDRQFVHELERLEGLCTQVQLNGESYFLVSGSPEAISDYCNGKIRDGAFYFFQLGTGRRGAESYPVFDGLYMGLPPGISCIKLSVSSQHIKISGTERHILNHPDFWQKEKVN